MYFPPFLFDEATLKEFLDHYNVPISQNSTSLHVDGTNKQIPVIRVLRDLSVRQNNSIYIIVKVDDDFQQRDQTW